MEIPDAYVASLREAHKLEAVVTSVGFDDLLDVTLPLNLTQLDAIYVVTISRDARTIQVCLKHGVMAVICDELHTGTKFAKGLGLNVGFMRLQYQGWRITMDADIVLPPHFRRVLLNYETLDHQCLYGADRVNLVGPDQWALASKPQWGNRDNVHTDLPIGPRLLSPALGYLPTGYFQMWHAQTHKLYPSTAGAAGLDDVAFATQWPKSHRRLLPSFLVYHLCVAQPVLSENWDGIRRHPRHEATGERV